MGKNENGDPRGPAALRALCRNNLYVFLQRAFEVMCPGQTFQPAPYLEAMCFALQGVAEGHETRLMISVAPRHLKSICASVLLPAFVLGRDPRAKVMVISYGGDLARDLAETFRRLVRSDLYKELFPETRFDPRADRIERMGTTEGGSRMSLSLAGPMTGKGASLIILDDLTKAGEVQYATTREDVRTKFDQSIYSRLENKKTGAIVSVAQRLHTDDITAYLLEKDSFRHLVLESIAQRPAAHALYLGRTYSRDVGDILSPAREPKEVLDQIRSEIGEYAFNAQYLQEPRPGQSIFLTLSDLGTVSELPPLECFTRRTQSWDTAANRPRRPCRNRQAPARGRSMGRMHRCRRWRDAGARAGTDEIRRLGCRSRACGRNGPAGQRYSVPPQGRKPSGNRQRHETLSRPPSRLGKDCRPSAD